MTSLRVGLVSGGATANGYVAEFIDWAKSHQGLDITHLLSIRRSGDLPRRSTSSAWSELAFRLINAVESRFLPASPVFGKNAERVDLRAMIPDVVEIDLPGYAGAVPRADQVDILSRLDLDLLVDLEDVIVPGELVGVTRLGIVAVANEDDRVKRGGPDGFWEVYLGSESTGFTIRHRTQDSPRESVLRRGLYPTRPFSALNQASIRAHSMDHLQSLIDELVTHGSIPQPAPEEPTPAAIYGPPTTYELAGYLARLLRRFVPKAINKLRRRTARWGVAFVAEPWREADRRLSTDIPNRPGHFLADPFLVERGGQHFCFVEDYDYSRGRAHIGVHRLAGDGSTSLGSVIQEPFHLSFPYVFEFEDELFMCPESAANHDVRIYRCVDFPLGWELAKVVWNDRKAWDTVVFPHEGRWWLLTALDPMGTGDYSSELHAFHAESPLSDSWTPHERNPVVVDHTRARNGGLIIEPSGIYRIGQRHGFGTYGRSSTINRIVELSPREFEEELVQTVEPDFRSDIEGTHHLHSDGTFTVFDFVRRERPDT